MTTFLTPNPVLKEDGLLVWFVFSNGQTESKLFPFSATIKEDIQSYGEERCVFFDTEEERKNSIIVEIDPTLLDNASKVIWQ